MRNLCWLVLLGCSWVHADVQVKVEANTLLRLPASGESLVLTRLEVADNATLLLPSSLNELIVAELQLGRDAHIGIAPSAQPFNLQVQRADFAAGSHISARGAAGTPQKSATAGRDLNLRLHTVQLSDLTVDVRGGMGAAGRNGSDGVAGESGGCFWGQATAGDNGQPAGNGKPGAAGGQLRLEVPANFAAQALTVKLQGGSGGVAGVAGSGGSGGASNNCLLYDAAGGSQGRAGAAGKSAEAGPEGNFKLLRTAAAE
jgi:hypothetical protein